MIISFDNTSFVKYGLGLKYCKHNGRDGKGQKVNTPSKKKYPTKNTSGIIYTYMHTV